jgi:DNA-binding NarL/FixJ family response regulator
MISLPPEARAAVHAGYLSGQFTVPILRQIYGASEDDVLALLRSMGIKGLFRTSERLAVIKRHQAGESQHTIARELKMCRKKVRAILKSFGGGA